MANRWPVGPLSVLIRSLSTRGWKYGPVLVTFTIILIHWIIQLQASPPAIGDDSALFLYTGRELLHGRVVYLHIWDIKPPAVHELSAFFALLSGNNPLVHYLFLSITTIVVASTIPGLLSVIAYKFTGSERAAFIAGIGVLVYPPFFQVAAWGTRPKFFTCAFGLLALYYYLEQRPLYSILTGTLAAAFWQLGVIFPLGILLGFYFEERASRNQLNRMLVVLTIVTLLLLLPIILRGAFVPMVVQVVLAPFVAAESGSVLAHWHRLRTLTGVSIIYLAIGGYGALIAVFDDTEIRGIHWVAVLIGWFFFQVLKLDLDGKPDPIPLFVFCGLGVAIVANNLDVPAKDKTELADGTIFILFITGLLLIIALPITGLPPVANQEQNIAEQLFWTGERVSQCHVQMSQTEQLWIERTPALPSDNTCWTPRWREIIGGVS